MFSELDTHNRGHCQGIELVAREDSRRTEHVERHPPGLPATSQSPEVRRLTSSTGRGVSSDDRKAEFPCSSVTAWDAAVTHSCHQPAAANDDDADERVEANARLTGMTALVLLLLLAVEGYTILRVGADLTLHVVIGMILVPPVLLKIGSTSWRFAALLPWVTGVQAKRSSARLASTSRAYRRRADAGSTG